MATLKERPQTSESVFGSQQMRRLVALQKHIYRASAAVHLARRDERQNTIPAPQPMIDSILQNRAAIAGTEPLAMHHTNAQVPSLRAVLNKVAKSWFGLGQGHPMQVDLRLHTVAAAGQLAHGAPAH